jgi:hypothetical protein
MPENHFDCINQSLRREITHSSTFQYFARMLGLNIACVGSVIAATSPDSSPHNRSRRPPLPSDSIAGIHRRFVRGKAASRAALDFHKQRSGRHS